MTNCRRIRINDQYHCGPCGKQWDVDDLDPPICGATLVSSAAVVDIMDSRDGEARAIPDGLLEDLQALAAQYDIKAITWAMIHSLERAAGNVIAHYGADDLYKVDIGVLYDDNKKPARFRIGMVPVERIATQEERLAWLAEIKQALAEGE